jgi:hypothetical protein
MKILSISIIYLTLIIIFTGKIIVPLILFLIFTLKIYINKMKEDLCQKTVLN